MSYLSELPPTKQLHAKRTVCLAAVFQVGWVVQELAERERWLSGDAEPLIKSLTVTSPDRFEDVYPDLNQLKTGLDLLSKTYTRQNITRFRNAVRYGVSLIQVEALLKKHNNLMDILGKGVTHFSQHHDMNAVWNERSTYERFSHLYEQTASTLRTRIMVNGQASVMKDEFNVVRTRSLLLAGIRAVMLWRQVGGTRWQLLFGRHKLVKSIKELANIIGQDDIGSFKLDDPHPQAISADTQTIKPTIVDRSSANTKPEQSSQKVVRLDEFSKNKQSSNEQNKQTNTPNKEQNTTPNNSPDDPNEGPQ